MSVITPSKGEVNALVLFKAFAFNGALVLLTITIFTKFLPLAPALVLLIAFISMTVISHRAMKTLPPDAKLPSKDRQLSIDLAFIVLFGAMIVAYAYFTGTLTF